MSSQAGKKRSVEQMIQNEDVLARGNQITLELNEESASAALAHFLREYRGRCDHARVVQHPFQESFAEKLEHVRHFLFEGNYSAAGELLSALSPNDDIEQAELAVEKCRLHLFLEEYPRAIEIATAALLSPALCELSRMTCFQMRGQCKLMLEDAPGAIEDLLNSIVLSEIYSRATAGFTAKGYLVCAYLKSGQRRAAEDQLAALHREIDSLESDELWLTRALIWIRTETHYLRAYGSAHDLKARLLESQIIANWTGDTRTRERCERELAEIAPVPTDAELASYGIFKYSGWTLLSRHAVVLSNSPRKVNRLHRSPVMEKAIRALASEPMGLDRFFETIWRLKFDPERHTVHVRATLSKLRKLLPEGALVVRDGVISLV